MLEQLSPNLIRSRREQKGLSHAGLAARLSPTASAQDVALWENGARQIPVQNLPSLRHALGMDDLTTVSPSATPAWELPDLMAIDTFLAQASTVQPLLEEYERLLGQLSPSHQTLLRNRQVRLSVRSEDSAKPDYDVLKRELIRACQEFLADELNRLLLLAPDEALIHLPNLAQSLRLNSGQK